MYAYLPVLEIVVAQVRASYSRQIRDKAHPAHGAFLAEHNLAGYPNADHTANSADLAKACQAYLAPGSPLEDDTELLERIRDSISFQCRWQRETGLIDLAQLNIHSPPDTGFTVNHAAFVVAVARAKAAASLGAQIIADELGEYVRTAAMGMIGRGFHTPNHRWVVCSATVHDGMSLYPDLPGRDYVESIPR